MVNSAVSNPRVTINIIPRDQRVGLEDHRALLVGQKTSSGNVPAGLMLDVPRTAAEINAAFGASSHLAMIARAFRRVNGITNLDAIVLEDAGGGTAATAVIVGAGTATADRTVYVTVASGFAHRYEVDVVIGETPATFMTKLGALITADTKKPFTFATTGTPVTTMTFTAANKGKCANSWPLIIEGLVPGLTFTLTAWAGGATDPTLTTVFDSVANMRHQTIVWPDAYTQSILKNHIDPRKNLDNDIKDGRGFIGSNRAFADVKSDALALNCSEIVILANEPNALASWKGPHTPECPDVIAATFAAARARRFEDGFTISDIVATNEFNDQFGGIDKASLPYFNTPFLFVRQPLKGSGYTDAEQVELRDAGVSIYGANRSNTGVVAGVIVTTWQFDVAGNPDDTWKYLEWRDTHGVIREYFVRNLRKEFAQSRLTSGVGIPNYSIADEASIRAFSYGLYDDLADICLTVKGLKARRIFEDRLSVVLRPDLRRVEWNADVPMVSQLGEILGSIKFNFGIGAGSAELAA